MLFMPTYIAESRSYANGRPAGRGDRKETKAPHWIVPDLLRAKSVLDPAQTVRPGARSAHRSEAKPEAKRMLFPLLNGQNGRERRADGDCCAVRGNRMFVPCRARSAEIDASCRVSVNPNVTNLKRSCYWLVPSIVEKHRTHRVFINIEHRFISFGHVY